MPRINKVVYTNYAKQHKTPSKYEEWKKSICTRPGEYENFDWWIHQHIVHDMMHGICPDAPYQCCPLCRANLPSDYEVKEAEIPYKKIVESCYIDFHIDIEAFNKLNKNYKRLPCISYIRHGHGGQRMDKAMFDWWETEEEIKKSTERENKNEERYIEILEGIRKRDYTWEYYDPISGDMKRFNS